MSDEFKIGDIVKSKNEIFQYEILEITKHTFTVKPTNPDYHDVKHTCKKSIFSKI